MQYKEWDDANSELFKESHDAALDKNTYEIRFCELISASPKSPPSGETPPQAAEGVHFQRPSGRLYGFSCRRKVAYKIGASKAPTFIYHLPFFIPHHPTSSLVH